MNKTFVTIGFLAATTVGFLAGQWFVAETPFDQCVRTHLEYREMSRQDWIANELELWAEAGVTQTFTFPNGMTLDNVPTDITTYDSYLEFTDGREQKESEIKSRAVRSAYRECNENAY